MDTPPIPPSIRSFSRCFWAATILSVVDTIIGWEDFLTFDDGTRAPAIWTALLLGAVLASYGLSIWLWLGITGKASDWARWLYVGLAIVWSGLTLWFFDEIYDQHDAIFVMATTILVLDIASMLFLLRRDSSDWFQRKIWFNPGTFE